jgi:hypothetical protein
MLYFFCIILYFEIILILERIGVMEKFKEEVTKYGEEVCTSFGWIPPEKQKENAEKLAQITNKKSKKKR